jgi:DNA polymerase epsilon subunit 1
LQFQNVPDLLAVRRAILPIADANRKKMDAMDAYTEVVQYVLGVGGVDNRSTLQFDDDIEESAASRPVLDAIEHIIDAREWDVPYHIRVAIDKGTLHRDVAKMRHSNWEMVHSQSESGTNHNRGH